MVDSSTLVALAASGASALSVVVSLVAKWLSSSSSTSISIRKGDDKFVIGSDRLSKQELEGLIRILTETDKTKEQRGIGLSEDADGNK